MSQPIKFSTLRNQLGLTGKVSLQNLITSSGDNQNSNIKVSRTRNSVYRFAPAIASNSTFQLWANTLSNLTITDDGATLSNWGSATQATASLRPTFKIDTDTNIKSVRFSGTSSTYNLLAWSPSFTANFGTNGGATYVVVVRFRSNFLQFHRLFMHNGASGNARTYEFVLANGGNNQQTITPIHYYANGTSSGTYGAMALNKWTLIVSRTTNGSPNKHEIFVNNMATPVLTTNITNALQNSTINSVQIGASGTPGGNSDIHFVNMYPRALNSAEMQNLYNTFAGVIQV